MTGRLHSPVAAAALCAVLSVGQPAPPASVAQEASSSPAATADESAGIHLLVIRGLGGTPSHDDRFADWASTLVDAAGSRYGLPTPRVTYLAPDPNADPERIDGASRREEVEAAFRDLAGRVTEEATVVVVLIGHGSQRRGRARFNLPGPDMTAAEFDELLGSLGAGRVAFVNTSSASAGFIPELAAPDRVVVTATATPSERNATVFPRFFVEALAGDGGDVDRDGAVSILEAFDYARREVERFYERQGRLATEHPRLDDDGDGVGSATPDPRSVDPGEGALARTIRLGAPGTVANPDRPGTDETGPELRDLRARREEIRKELDELRSRKEELESDRYLEELEALLVRLARLDRRIRELSGSGGPEGESREDEAVGPSDDEGGAGGDVGRDRAIEARDDAGVHDPIRYGELRDQEREVAADGERGDRDDGARSRAARTRVPSGHPAPRAFLTRFDHGMSAAAPDPFAEIPAPGTARREGPATAAPTGYATSSPPKGTATGRSSGSGTDGAAESSLRASSVRASLPIRPAQDDSPARAARRAGRYDEAIAAYRRRLERDPDPEAARALAQTLMLVGRYAQAERTLRRHGADAGPALAATLGRVLVRRGQRDEAEEVLRTAMEGDGPGNLEARVELALLLEERGRREPALELYDGLIDRYNSGAATSSRALVAVATACRRLGILDPDLYVDAVRAYEEAIAAAPRDHRPRILLAELFIDKYNSTDARELLDGVLEENPRNPRALLAMARSLEFDGSPRSLTLVRRSLEVNPRLVPARVFLAKLLLTQEDVGAAVDQARAALEVDPGSLEALSMLAAARYLDGDRQGFESYRDRALELNPRYAALFSTVAELCVQNRLYDEAVRFARRGVELDPESWEAHGLLGRNQLRVGEMRAGRRHLEIAFEGDPYDVWIANTLQLLDTLATYREVEADGFRFVLEPDEADLLIPYLRELATEALESLSDRYAYEPPGSVRAEVYARHADFSVRTVGLAGVGALGVSFGPVIAIASPSAREPGSFNWGSTLWHEIAHTVTLGATRHRIPRWLSEGLSVFEERRARPGWGPEVTPGFLVAHLQGRLLPVSELTDGFVRPAYPQQVAHSYYQASLVCELIERRYGFPAIRAILDGYRSGATTEEIFRDVLGLGPEQLDALFEEYLEERFATRLVALRSLAERSAAPEADSGHGANPLPPVSPGSGADDDGATPVDPEVERRGRERPDDFMAQLEWGIALYRARRLDDAVEPLGRARDLFPEYVGPANPYTLLAEIHRREQRGERAIEELGKLVQIDETAHRSHARLAEMLRRQGDPESAAEILERAIYIEPFEADDHRLLARLYGEIDRPDAAVRERRAVLALEPADRASALYRLAAALRSAGRLEEARLRVLEALEIAPGFPEAQELLLELHDAREGER